jgi:hypothetical protein
VASNPFEFASKVLVTYSHAIAIFPLAIDQSKLGLRQKIFESVATNSLVPNQYLPNLTDFRRHYLIGYLRTRLVI